jgi:Zn-dependent peptidase ImmA (M78 family)
MIHSKAARENADNIIEMYQIDEAPIDVFGIAERLGFVVDKIDLPNEIPARVEVHEDIKVIFVNSKHPTVKQRFSVGHELGHYLSGHENFSADARSNIDPDKKYLNPQYQQEYEADDFAAEILMPKKILKIDVLENNLSLQELVEKYEVSEQSMTIQLVNLKLPFNQKK